MTATSDEPVIRGDTVLHHVNRLMGTLAALGVPIAAAARLFACSSSADSFSEDVGGTRFKLTLADLNPVPGMTLSYAARTERFYARNGPDVTTRTFFAGGLSGTSALASDSAQKVLADATFTSGS